MKYSHKNFIEKLKLQFPEIINELNDPVYKSLLHLEVGAFARYTQNQVNNKNLSVYVRCIKFIHSVFVNCSDELANAIGVSYLEHLNLEKENNWAYKKLPPILKSNYDTLHQ